MPIWARLKDKDVQLQNSRVAMGLSRWTIVAIGVILVAFGLLLFLVDIIR